MSSGANSLFDEALDYYDGYYLTDDVVFTENLRRALAGEELELPNADYDDLMVKESMAEWTERVTFTTPPSESSEAKWRNPANWSK